MVSIIVPCYNCANFVERAIQSVLNQTFQDFEILLIDNNSTDDTWAVINSYSDKFPVIKSYQEPKKGSAAARNKGLYLAKGEWIQFLDADDELLPGKLALQLQLAEKENADVVVGSAVSIVEDGEKITKTDLRPVTHDKWVGLIMSKMGITSANLWKRDIVINAGGWSEQLSSSQEYDLMFRIFQLDAKVAFDNSLQANIYKRKESISRTTEADKLRNIIDNRLQLRNRIKAYLAGNNQLNAERAKAVNEYIYVELIRNKEQIPAYVDEKISTVKVSIMLKIKCSAWYKNLKNKLKN